MPSLEGKKKEGRVTTKEEICVIKMKSGLRLGERHQARGTGSRGLVLIVLERQTPSSQEAEHMNT